MTTRSDRDETRLRDTIDRLDRQIGDITRDLEALQDRVRAGDVTAVGETTKMCQEIRKWIGFAMEMEAKLDDGRQGQRAGGDIDLGAARASIGCRLDRLRRCGHPERIPG
ncbi:MULTISPECIES: hypothetical protein [Pseudooceanicola]|uniref:hypothetical protein n=1 Tax=Pseudooceanicola TaxID=1679449 RepID=UPI001EEFE3E3|nr:MULTISPECIES: hypothetical protein [Pseudooceanicola]